MNWAIVFEPDSLALYGQGILVTLGLLSSSLAAGAVLAVIFAIGLAQGPRWLARLIGTYTYVMRGTPLLVQVYLIYYGLGQLEWIQARWDEVWPWTYFKEPFFCAWLAFTLNTAGYTAEIVAGAMRETSAGEVEAAMAVGMSRSQVLRLIVLPSALRRSLPAYSNEVVMLLQSTSLASAVPAMTDITAAASRIYSDYYLPFEAYSFAALLYIVITFGLIGLFRLAERRYLSYLVVRRT